MLEHARKDRRIAKVDHVPAIEAFFARVLRDAATRTEVRSLFQGYKEHSRSKANPGQFAYLLPSLAILVQHSLALRARPLHPLVPAHHQRH